MRCRRERGCPEWSGGSAGDPMIAGIQCEARPIRTQAFVSDGLRPGRRAKGASVPPWLCLLVRGLLINVRGEACALRERRPLGRGLCDGHLCPERCPRPAVRPPFGGRDLAGRSRYIGFPLCLRASVVCPVRCICVICGQAGCLCVFALPLPGLRLQLPQGVSYGHTGRPDGGQHAAEQSHEERKNEACSEQPWRDPEREGQVREGLPVHGACRETVER